MDIFEIMGPVMIGPSSSHTAGAVRIGLIARELLRNKPVKAEILLSGSFARTYLGHGTDKALIAGIMGFKPDDERIRHAPEIAEKTGLSVSISTGDLPDTHPNTAKIALYDAGEYAVHVIGSSIGGGNILISEVNGLHVHITGEKTTLIILHRDQPGIIASVAVTLAECGVNISNFHLFRQERGGHAVMTLGLDGTYGEELNDRISSLPHILSSTILQPI